MNEEFKGFRGFWRGVFSEADATPSASRLITLLLSVVSCYCIVVIVRAVVGMPADRAGLFLNALPWIIGSLVALIGAPYAINQGKNVVSDVLQNYVNKK